MQILTLEDQIFNLNELPDEIDDDLRFAVLDREFYRSCCCTKNRQL